MAFSVKSGQTLFLTYFGCAEFIFGVCQAEKCQINAREAKQNGYRQNQHLLPETIINAFNATKIATFLHFLSYTRENVFMLFTASVPHFAKAHKIARKSIN